MDNASGEREDNNENVDGGEAEQEHSEGGSRADAWLNSSRDIFCDRMAKLIDESHRIHQSRAPQGILANLRNKMTPTTVASRFEIIRRLIALSLRLDSLSGDVRTFYSQAARAAQLAAGDEPQIAACRLIIDDLERAVSATATIRYVIGGLLIYLIITAVLLIVLYTRIKFDDHYNMLVLSTTSGDMPFAMEYAAATLLGPLGTVVSIFFRLGEFERLVGRSKTFLMLTGALLPIVGSIFAFVVYNGLRAGLVGLTLNGNEVNVEGNLPLAIVVGFLCGFSERFARGMLEKVAGGMTSASEKSA